jgi:regulator of sigma E protease
VSASVPVWMWIVGFLLVLGPLVTLHELGHYLAGRIFGVQAVAFSVGFGKEIAGFTDRRGTRWKLALLPLGGYVQFKGDMNPASVPDAEALARVPEDERRANFHFKPLWQRAIIVFAGPLTNLLIALAIFAAFFAFIGKPVSVDPAETTLVKQFAEVSVAREAGIRIGDRIVAIDGQTVDEFQDIQDRVALYPGKRIVVGVERQDAGRLAIPVTIQRSEETDQFGNKAVVGRLGVYSSPFEFQRVGVGQALALSVDYSIGLVKMMATGLAQIVTGERSVKELGGPLKIAKFSGEQLSLGPLAFVNFIALISINLAFINLLPIPALDGGHLAFYAAEAIRRKPLGQRSQEWAFRTGIGLVLALMLFVTINDIASLPVFGS